MKIKNNKKSYKTSLLTSMIKQSKKFNEKIQIKRTRLALSFREQLTRYYHKESSSPRVAIADRGR
jgi:hypothetical protein